MAFVHWRPDIRNPSVQRIAAVRAEELRALAREGWPVEAQTRWHWTAGDLHLWPEAGRWLDVSSGAQGKMYGVTMRELLERQGIRPTR